MNAKIIAFAAGLVAITSSAAAGFYEKATVDQRDAAKNTRAVRFLSPQESRGLKLTTAPNSDPSALIVGHDWRCYENSFGWEFCEPVLIICTDDQSSCVEV